MKEKEVSIMLGTIREIYGRQGENPNPEFGIKLWHRYLKDEPTVLVQQAFDEYIANNVYAPKPAEILKLVEKAKWKIYQKVETDRDAFGVDRNIPREYLPRSITNTPKEFERFDLSRVLKSMDDVLKLESAE